MDASPISSQRHLMKKHLMILIACGFLQATAPQAWSAGPTYVEKNILVPTHWTLADSPYVISNDVTVSTNAILTIDPGVVVRFPALTGDKAGKGPNLIVRGGLRAEGDAKNFISFIPTIPGNSWGSIYFYNSDPAHSILKGCKIIGGRVACVGSSPTITGCAMARASRAIEVSTNSNPRILGNRIQGNGYGLLLSADSASPVVQNNEITGNNFGLYLKAFNAPTVKGNRIHGNLKYDLVNGTAKSLDVTGNYFNSTDPVQVAKGIYDGSDNPALGRLVFMAPAAAASTQAPAQAKAKPGSFIPQFSMNLGLSGSYLFTGSAYPVNGDTSAPGFGGALFADYRPLPWISLGAGGTGSFIAGTDSFRLATLDVGGRLFPFERTNLGEPYLLGGLGMNLVLQTQTSALLGHYHGFAGLGYRFTLNRSNALEVGAQYDYFSPQSQPRHLVGLKVGWTILIDAQ